MKEIRIIRQDNQWAAEHLEDGQPDTQVTALFHGRHVLPTPFLASTPVEVVFEDLRTLNPDKMVTLSGEETNWFDYWRRLEAEQSQETPVHRIQGFLPTIDDERRVKATANLRTACGIETAAADYLSLPASWLLKNTTCAECLAVPPRDFAREAHERLGIAYRPNEAPRFA